MSKFLPCKSVCPVVRDLRMHNAELRHDIANLKGDIMRLKLKLKMQSESKESCEARLAKIRQLCFGEYPSA